MANEKKLNSINPTCILTSIIAKNNLIISSLPQHRKLPVLVFANFLKLQIYHAYYNKDLGYYRNYYYNPMD